MLPVKTMKLQTLFATQEPKLFLYVTFISAVSFLKSASNISCKWNLFFYSHFRKWHRLDYEMLHFHLPGKKRVAQDIRKLIQEPAVHEQLPSRISLIWIIRSEIPDNVSILLLLQKVVWNTNKSFQFLF